MPSPDNAIRVRGAKKHNLKNIDVDIPRNRLTVITGVSGSGKSSLAFDTIYAEGQRRYVESLSTYARQFLERMEKAEVDLLEGISPAIAIGQKNEVKTARSTVGTATEIYDHLRLLFARIGRTYCTKCDRLVHPDSVKDIVDAVRKLPSGTRALIAFPLTPGTETSLREVIQNLRALGFIRLVVQEKVVELEEIEDAQEVLGEELLVVVDRLILRGDLRKRLADSAQTAMEEGGGSVVVWREKGKNLKFSDRFHCAHCDLEYLAPSPLLFSFNSPYGACPECHGFGNKLELDLDLIVPNRQKTLRQGAIEPWTKSRRHHFVERLEELSYRHGVRLDVPFFRLTESEVHMVLEGAPGFRGVYDFFRRIERKKYKIGKRVLLRRYQSQKVCPRCRGSRLRPEALYVTVDRKTIAEIAGMNVAEAAEFFLKLKLTTFEKEVASQILKEIQSRLDYLERIGLSYLTLNRLTRTLSGGEAQRIHLATSLGHSLSGTLYVLDEPTIGLHPRDTRRLIDILGRLRDNDNTVLVVEHDRETIRASDSVIDLGPGAGEQGGQLVFQGSVQNLEEKGESLTARYLTGKTRIPLPKERRKLSNGRLEILGAREHNLKNLNLVIPLGGLVCVTGVSGSGKSSLVHDILYRALNRRLHNAIERVGGHQAIRGEEQIEDALLVDQAPIGRTPRSNPVTYIKAFTPIRELFAKTQGARVRGYSPGRFSFNVPGGRCGSCQGEGQLRVEMHFMADIFITCEACQGRRYNRESLEVTLRGKNIAQVLNLTVDQALDFFSPWPRIVRGLKVLVDVGLGYIRLGQPATTLSGGEAQRIKIARELARKKGRGILYILDEPTVGLHFHDIKKLLDALNALIAEGNSVLMIEHNPEVIKVADWVIDLGPEGGEQGGYLVAAGPPEEIASCQDSHTGRYLREYLRKPGSGIREPGSVKSRD
jgi:excinuclease ABC subunit A